MNANYQMHSELKHGKNPISNVCLGGCTITSKAKINIFEKKISLCWSLWDYSLLKTFKKMLILAFGGKHLQLSYQITHFSTF